METFEINARVRFKNRTQTQIRPMVVRQTREGDDGSQEVMVNGAWWSSSEFMYNEEWLEQQLREQRSG